MILEPKDIDTMREWWAEKGAPLISEILPPLGFCEQEGDELMCGCFLYIFDIEGGKAGLVSHTITNPKRPLVALKSVNAMLLSVRLWCGSNDIIHLMGFTRSRLLAKSYTDNDFQLAESNTNLFIL